MKFPMLIGLAAATLTSPAGAAQISDLEGHWRTVRHGAEVRISDCGDGSPCGYLVSVSDEISRGDTRDIHNRTAALRGRPLQGLPILWGYSEASTGWRAGKLYNPETGQTFGSSLKLLSPERLLVKGCIGPLCRAQIWQRLPVPQVSHQERATHD